MLMPTRSRKQRQKSYVHNMPGNIATKVTQKRSLCFLFLVAGVVAVVLSASLLTLYGSISQEEGFHRAEKQVLNSGQEIHSSQRLANSTLHNIATYVDMDRLWDTLTPMLVVRTPGSANIERVKQHITSTLNGLGSWQIEYDSFYARPPPPYNKTKFTNIIASTNPSASRKLILACHYDSKIFEDFVFVAATDSAVPCAIMLEIAQVLNSLLKEHTQRQMDENPAVHDISLDLVFFDGEEAFREWTATDSLYGARHLAKKWKNTMKKNKTFLQAIDLFILLDLIGHKETAFHNIAATHSDWFMRAHSVETRLINSKLLPRNKPRYFVSASRYRHAVIEDDHVPFHKAGVPIMHLISLPFPHVWHKAGDNEDILDRSRIEGLTKILSVFVAEYLHLIIPPK